MKLKIKAKNHGITKLNFNGWSESEEQAIKDIGRNFKFRENFNLPEQVLRASHSIKHSAAILKSNPSVEEKKAYIQEMLLLINGLITLSSIGRMGKSIKNELEMELEIQPDDLNDIFHSVNNSLLKALKNINEPKDKERKIHSKNDEFPTKAELKKIATEYLCRIFLIGSSVDSTLTTDTNSNKNKGNLYQFLIEIKPFFEIKSGIKLGTNASIGRNSFDARKNAIENLKSQSEKMNK